MKRLLFAIPVIFLTLGIYAQPRHEFSMEPIIEAVGNAKQQVSDRLRSEHIAYLTRKLDLTPEEAQAFWPIYNEAEAKQRAHVDRHNNAREALKAVLDNGGSEAEIQKALDEYNESKTGNTYVLSEYQEKFERILGTEKTAKLYLAEDGFLLQQIQRLSDKPQRPPEKR